MHFEGGIRGRGGAGGPQRSVAAEGPGSGEPAGDSVHGVPFDAPPGRAAGASREQRVGARQEIVRPSVGLFDRRTRVHIASASLPLPGDVRRRAAA